MIIVPSYCGSAVIKRKHKHGGEGQKNWRDNGHSIRTRETHHESYKLLFVLRRPILESTKIWIFLK